MNVRCFIEIVKSILTMTFTGSIVSAFLFTIKPIIKDKLPKSFQYYMWFPVIMAFLLPLSQIAARPVLSNRTMPIKSMQDIAQWIADMAFDKPVNFPLVQQMGEGKGILQTTAHKELLKYSSDRTVLVLGPTEEGLLKRPDTAHTHTMASHCLPLLGDFSLRA